MRRQPLWIVRQPAVNPFRNRKPILDPAEFYGREREVQQIAGQLAIQPPQCCAVVGLPRTGKTSLLYYLHHQALRPSPERMLELRAYDHILPVYVNVGPYQAMGPLHTHGARYFWQDLATALAQAMGTPTETLALPPMQHDHSDARALDHVHALRYHVAELIRTCSAELVLLLLDNAEAIATMPHAVGSLLRTLTQDPALGNRIAYVATSHVPLHLLSDPATLPVPSSFWSLFTEPVYLGQLEPAAANALLQRVSPATGHASLHPPHPFSPHDEQQLVRLASRHPDLLTLAGALLYDQQLAGTAPRHPADWATFEQQLFEVALPILQATWQAVQHVPHASALLYRLAHLPHTPLEPEVGSVLTLLARYGLIELGPQGRGHVSAAVLRRFIGEQPSPADALPLHTVPAPVAPAASPPPAAPASEGLPPAFTHLEAEVYAFLAQHAGEVCAREQIKHAIWPTDPPSDSALQKLIERIREKIEPDPKHPRRLIAVRGQGYILYPETPAA
ncbi:MAG: AAA family ATPase [Chloroflexaceae bacterium]|nr:AAA family ATPase [Chloroflexaceae bacterium]